MPILPVLINDVPEITTLVNSAYRGKSAEQGWTNESRLLEGIRIDEAELTGYFEKDNTTLLKYTDEHQKIIGFVYLEKLNSNKLYLGMLTVQPDLQASGIGRLLLQAADEEAKIQGCTAIKITVINKRHELIAWYQRRGFTDTGKTMPLVTEKSTSKEPLTLMVMEKDVGVPTH